ncbi:MAG: sensor histidine kinase [Erysipelotrichaceae bacterium]
MLKEHLWLLVAIGVLGWLGLTIFNLSPFFILFSSLVGAAGLAIVYSNRSDRYRRSIVNELKLRLSKTAKDNSSKSQLMEKIIGALPFPIMLLDLYGNLVLCNNHMQEFNREPSAEGETYLNNGFVHEMKEFIKEAYILEKEKQKIITIRGIEYQCLAVPITKKGKFNGSLIVLNDISETLQGEKKQKRFIADASHELKTPISIIKGMVEILTREDFHDETIRKDFLEQIKNENERLEVIVKDMLLLSKLSSDHVLLKRELCDVNAVLDRAMAPFVGSFERKNIRIITKYELQEPCFIDADKFMQVFTNLFQNALAYTDTGFVKITSQPLKKGCLISIQDSGCGIDEMHQQEVFERLFRVDQARARNSGGSGLGLAISKSIVEAHQGKIWVESKVGVGSTFYIQLKA